MRLAKANHVLIARFGGEELSVKVPVRRTYIPTGRAVGTRDARHLLELGYR
jgi:hypothetical protein